MLTATENLMTEIDRVIAGAVLPTVFKASRDIPLVLGAFIVGLVIYFGFVFGLRALINHRGSDKSTARTSN